MIIDGRAIAAQRLETLKKKVETSGLVPSLKVILVGDAAESQLYVRMKAKRAEEVGIETEVIQIQETGNETQVREIEARIEGLNADRKVHGILVQLPFPKASPCEAGQREILDAIDPLKDVDCLTSLNMGFLAVGEPRFYPATVKAVLIAMECGLGMKNGPNKNPTVVVKLFGKNGDPLAGKDVVVVGRSEIVGKPVAMALTNLGATVTVCNKSTGHLSLVTRQADILVSATGVAHLIKADMVKPGAVVVDVGINAKDGMVTGDVDFEYVSKVAAAISPVPGGIGPLTIVSLLENTFEAARIQSLNMASVK